MRILLLLIVSIACARGASSSIRISQLINFEAGANGEVVNDTESDTNTWNSMIQGNNKGGFVRYTLGGSGHITIDTSLQVELLRPITLASGTTYYETNSTRSFRMDNVTQAELMRYYFNGGAKPKVSWGYFIKFNNWTADGNFYDMIFMQGVSGEFSGFALINNTTIDGRVHTQAGVATPDISLTKNKVYWVTQLWDSANTISKLRFYDPVTWRQVGAEQTLAIANTSADFLAIGRFDAHQNGPSGSVFWYDNIIIDDTGANFPMFPASAWVADSPARADVSTVYTSSSAGDQIVLPMGSNLWTAALSLNKDRLTVSGISTNASGTWVTNGGSGIQDYIFTVDGAGICITNIAFAGTNSGRVSGLFYSRALELNGLYSSVGWCLFKFFDTAMIHQAPGSVTYRAMFLDNRIFSRVFSVSQSGNWTTYGPAGTFSFCTTNMPFIEDCIIGKSSAMPGDTSVNFSSQEGQMWCIRHCYFKDDSSWDYSPVFDFHGPTDPGVRGGIAFILSSNYFDFSGSGATFDRLVDIRGGAGLVLSNVVIGQSSQNSRAIFMRVANQDTLALYYENSGIEQVTNCWFSQNTQPSGAFTIDTEVGGAAGPDPASAADDRVYIVPGASWSNALPSFCVVPTYPMPLRRDISAAAPSDPPASVPSRTLKWRTLRR